MKIPCDLEFSLKWLLDHIYRDMKIILQLLEVTSVAAEYAELDNIIMVLIFILSKFFTF